VPVRSCWRSMGPLINAAIRLSILYFLTEVWLKPNDPRFAGKAIPLRNLIVVGGMSLVFPGLHLAWKQRKWRRYPFGLDNLYLSIFWLDMAGNSLNLYDRYRYFDAVPHFHGTGAIAVVLQRVLGLSTLGAIGLANIVHLLLEAQEYYTDVLFGTHNVRGTWDTINDLLAGLAGSTTYAIAEARWEQRASRR
jgi:hypothetical protein